MIINTKKYPNDDDIAVVKLNGVVIYKGWVDSVDEYIIDAWLEDMDVCTKHNIGDCFEYGTVSDYLDALWDSWDSETMTYKKDDVEILILDI